MSVGENRYLFEAKGRTVRPMTLKKNLEAAVAVAEANLLRAVSTMADAGDTHGEAGDNVSKARTVCRQARAALNAFESAERN